MMKILMINDSQTCVCFTVPGARYEIHQFWVCVSVSLASHYLLNSVELEELWENLESLNGIESLQFF